MPSPRATHTTARLALAPGLLGAIVCLAALPMIGSSWYVVVRYVVAILALIICVFAWQGKNYWWLIGLVPIAVLFQPIAVIPLSDLALYWVHFASTVVFIGVGVTTRVKVEDDKGRPAGRYDGAKVKAKRR
jgi:hypothetical protein